MVTVIAKGGEEVQMEEAVARKSGLISDILDDNPEESVPLNDIEKAHLDKVHEFMKRMKDHEMPEIAKPVTTNNFADAVTDQWSIQYIDSMEEDEVFAIGLAANKMNVQKLLELVACKIATRVKGQSVETMRAVFGMENDFTPEEEAQVAEEIKMAEENF